MVVDYDEEETGSVGNELVVGGEEGYGVVNDELEAVAPTSLEEWMTLEDVLQWSLMVMLCSLKLLVLLLLLLKMNWLMAMG